MIEMIKQNLINGNLHIPLGMYRSVERNNNAQPLPPVREASLTGCKRGVLAFSTERRIPNGIPFPKLKIKIKY